MKIWCQKEGAQGMKIGGYAPSPKQTATGTVDNWTCVPIHDFYNLLHNSTYQTLHFAWLGNLFNVHISNFKLLLLRYFFEQFYSVGRRGRRRWAQGKVSQFLYHLTLYTLIVTNKIANITTWAPFRFLWNLDTCCEWELPDFRLDSLTRPNP